MVCTTFLFGFLEQNTCCISATCCLKFSFRITGIQRLSVKAGILGRINTTDLHVRVNVKTLSECDNLSGQDLHNEPLFGTNRVGLLSKHFKTGASLPSVMIIDTLLADVRRKAVISCPAAVRTLIIRCLQLFDFMFVLGVPFPPPQFLLQDF